MVKKRFLRLGIRVEVTRYGLVGPPTRKPAAPLAAAEVAPKLW
jgi:hypothetical protein